MKRKLIYLLVILLIALYFMPKNASDIISETFTKENISVNSFIITYPGAYSGISEYEISDKGLEFLFNDLANMKVIRFPIVKYVNQKTPKEKFSIDLVENSEKIISIRIFRNQIYINDKYYLIINPEKVFLMI